MKGFGAAARSCRVTMSMAFAESWANRRSFWLQVLMMAVNDIVWIAFWVILFRRVGSIRGWDVDLVITLFAILTTSAGIVLGLLANARRIAVLAADGGLDAALSLPTPTLPHVLSRRVEPVNLGDIVFGVVLFVVAGDPNPQRVLLFVFGVACSVLVVTGFLVLLGSSAFFLGRSEAGELGFQALLLFSSYPVDIFAGATKIFLYVVVPAGFVSSVPARILEDFNVAWAAAMAAVALAAVSLGSAAFTFGLRRYTGGSLWTQA